MENEKIYRLYPKLDYVNVSEKINKLIKLYPYQLCLVPSEIHTSYKIIGEFTSFVIITLDMKNLYNYNYPIYTDISSYALWLHEQEPKYYLIDEFINKFISGCPTKLKKEDFIYMNKIYKTLLSKKPNKKINTVNDFRHISENVIMHRHTRSIW